MVTLATYPGVPYPGGRFPSIRKFVLEAPIRGARFVQKGDPSRFLIVHPSTKEPGRWQISSFDDEGASGDTQRNDAAAAVAEVSAYLYEIAEVA